MQIRNKIILITGGANGLGYAYAKEFLRNGASNVAILDLANSNGEGASERLNVEFGKGRSTYFVCDVSKAQELEAGFKKTVEKFGALDVVVNNAGIANDFQWELMISVNVNAVIRGTLLGLQYMGRDKGSKGGVIVNIATILGLEPSSNLPIYTGTKHAVLGLSKSFGTPYHYEKTGVRILTICPGCIEEQIYSGIESNFPVTTDTKLQVNETKQHPFQKVQNIAHGMMFIIRSAQNGSVWVAEGVEPIYEILVPDRLMIKIPPKD